MMAMILVLGLLSVVLAAAAGWWGGAWVTQRHHQRRGLRHWRSAIGGWSSPPKSFCALWRTSRPTRRHDDGGRSRSTTEPLASD